MNSFRIARPMRRRRTLRLAVIPLSLLALLATAGPVGGPAFAADPPPAAEAPQTADDLLSLAVIAHRIGKKTEAVSYFDAAAKAAAADGPESVLAMALFNKGVLLADLERYDEALAAFDTLIHRFQGAEDATLREAIARAMVSKGALLADTEQPAAAIAACEDLLYLFGASEVPEIRDQVAKALINKGIALDAMEQAGAAIAAFDEALARYAADTGPDPRAQIAAALGGRALARLHKVLRESEATTPADALGQALYPALADAETALDLNPEDAAVLLARAHMLALLGREDEAEADLRRALELGGRMARRLALPPGGTAPHGSTVFREMVDRLSDELFPR